MAKDTATSSRLGFELRPDQVVFELDESVYSLEAIYGACYLYLERCFVLLTRPRPAVVTVTLTAQESATAAELDRLAGEFVNECLAQVARLRLAQTTMRIREYYTAAALRAAAPAPLVDDLLAELESDDLLEDPLEIMVPWEEQQGAAGASDPKKDSNG
jgi:His-Xaa-Ser system protein HxsD